MTQVIPLNEKYSFAIYPQNAKGRFGVELRQATPKARYSTYKAVEYYTFATEELRDKWIIKASGTILKNIRAAIAEKREKAETQKAARKALKIEIGAIFCNSWGYDQTNVDFYEVVEVSGCMVTVREIASRDTDSGHDCGHCVAMPGEFIGEPLRKRVSVEGNSIWIPMGHGYCGLWDGKPKYFSTYA